MIKVEKKFDPITNMLHVVLSHECEENLNKFEMFLGLDDLEHLLCDLESELKNFTGLMYEVDDFDLECRFTKEEITEMIDSELILPSDGFGHWGTESHCSDINIFKAPPEWATHGYWYNK